MSRTTAIILTAASAMICGIPSLAIMCFAALAFTGTQMPEVMAQNPGVNTGDVFLGGGMMMCIGIVLFFIPLIVGVISFRISKPDDDEDDLPPASPA